MPQRYRVIPFTLALLTGALLSACGAGDPATSGVQSMTRTAADPRLARDYMLRISMIESLRKHACA